MADSTILKLPKIPLSTKELLPEDSGIYYILDETYTVWYIGKAKNLRKRWQGKSHHRFYQLEAQKKQSFLIYYESVPINQLDTIETERITQYNPYLNQTSVKTKKLRPTETLLRETIVAIADFAFIIGVEPPRQEIASQILYQGLGHKKVLDLTVIHIALNFTKFQEKFRIESIEEEAALIKKIFKTRKAYAQKWEGIELARFYRLYVNNYAIEVNSLSLFLQSKIEKLKDYHKITLAEEPINVLTPECLSQFQQNIDNDKPYAVHFQRLIPYKLDPIKLFFNETIDQQVLQQNLIQISEDYKTGKRGVGSRLNLIQSKLITPNFMTIDELLLSRGIELQKYDQNKVITFRKLKGRIGLYLQHFSVKNYQKPYYNSVEGILDNQKKRGAYSQFTTVYVLVSVDKKAWLLVEEYLKDFANPASQLKNGEGFIDKFYISPRKYITPAKVNIRLEKMEYSAWIPFGYNIEFPSFETAKEEIKRRLKNADLPDIKLTFKRESVQK